MANGNTVGRYLVGRNTSLMSCGAMYIAPNGTLTPGGDFVDLHSAGTFDTFDVSLDYGLEDIHPTDAQIKNFVKTVVDFEWTVGEIQGPGGYSKILSIGMYQSDYFGTEAVTYDAATGEYFNTSIVGIFQSIRYGIVEGKNVAMAVFKPCGIFPYFALQAGQGAAGAAVPAGGLPTGAVRSPRIVTSIHP